MRYEFDFQMDEKTLSDFYLSYNMGGFSGLLFIFYIPWDLKRKAKKQIEKNPVYAKPIHYILDEEGVTTTQGENKATVEWNNFGKIKVTKKSMILYMRNRNACVLSKEVFGEDFDKAYEWIKSKTGQR